MYNKKHYIEAVQLMKTIIKKLFKVVLISIYILSNGVHTDIVVPVRNEMMFVDTHCAGYFLSVQVG